MKCHSEPPRCDEDHRHGNVSEPALLAAAGAGLVDIFEPNRKLFAADFLLLFNYWLLLARWLMKSAIRIRAAADWTETFSGCIITPLTAADAEAAAWKAQSCRGDQRGPAEMAAL